MPSFTVSSSQAFDDLARNRATTRASRTLLAATQAFIATPLHDKRSKAQFHELFRHFFPKTDLEDRQAIAKLIADHGEAPKDVLLLLCCDEESVACPILRTSRLLDEETLTTQILQGTTAKREAIANRQDLTANLASQLISFAEPSVLVCLEQHIDKLPEIAERLHDILGAESEMAELQEGSTDMGPNDQDYDKLVAEMERDWYEHYHPEELVAAEERMLNASDEALAAAFRKSDESEVEQVSQNSAPELSDSPSQHSDLLDDHADLDVDVDLEFEEQEEEPRRFSFSIFAEDEDNAAIPPLEANDDSARPASIAFKGAADSIEAIESSEPVAVEDEVVSEAALPLSQDTEQAPSLAIEQSVVEPIADAKPSPARGRINFEIRASKTEEADSTPAPSKAEKVAPVSEQAAVPSLSSLHQQAALREEDESESMQLGPAPAPFVPRDIPNERSDDDWEQALAHLSKPVDDLPKVRSDLKAHKSANPRASARRDRTDLPQVAPKPKAEQPQKSQAPQMKDAALVAKEATISFTRMQSAPIALKAETSPHLVVKAAQVPENKRTEKAITPSQAEDKPREARISMPTGPRQASSSDKGETKAVAKQQQVAAETEQAFLDKASLPPAVLAHTLFDASQIKECVLVENPGPHGATIDSMAAKADLAKPELPLATAAPAGKEAATLPAQATIDAFEEKASLNKPEIAALLQDMSLIEPPMLKTGIPDALSESDQPDSDVFVDETKTVAEIALERSAGLSKLGFMPSMIDLEDLDLVEAIPDMPSASEAMMDHQQERATPAIELVEPIELYFADDQDMGASSAQSPMMIVAAQIEAERDKATQALEGEKEQTTLSVLQEEHPAATSANPILQVQAEEQAKQDDELQQEAAQVHISIRRNTDVEELINEAGDLTDLPELSQHQVIEAEDLAALKAAQTSEDALIADIAEEDELSVAIRPAARHTGSMDQFLSFDEETRLAILQSMISATVPMDRAERFRRWDNGRPNLAEKQSSALLMARFASDTDNVAQVMTEISGHRKADMIKLLQDPGGEALIAYLASVGLDESRALSMVLHAPDALSHSYDKVSKLMTLFDQMHPAASLTIVEQLLGAQTSKDAALPRHVAQLDEGLGEKAPRLRGSNQAPSQSLEREPTITFGRRNSGKS